MELVTSRPFMEFGMLMDIDLLKKEITQSESGSKIMPQLPPYRLADV